MNFSFAKLMMIFSLFVISSQSSMALKKKHRHHEAHVHGAAELSIAFDQLKGQVEFKAASDGLLGFEYQAQSEADKKKLAETISVFENKITQMIQLDQAANCQWTKEKVEMVFSDKSANSAASKKETKKANHKHHNDHHAHHAHSQKQGEHSDFIAQFSFVCQKDLMGTQLIIDFSSFKKLSTIETTLLIGSLQKSVKVKSKPLQVDLK